MGKAIYVRISEDREGEGLGVARQIEDCQAYAAARGWEVAEVYIDNDASAYRGKFRPQYRRMLDDIRAGGLDGVIVYHIDRLTRSPKELEEFIEVCDQAKVGSLATVTGELDLGSYDGMFTARILAAVARKESDDKSRRIKRKHLEIARLGRWAGGTRPYGYDEHRDVVAEEAAVIKEAAGRVLAGESLRSVCIDLNRRGIPSAQAKAWREGPLRGILIHPGIAGFRALDGEIVSRAVWEPIISEGESARLRALLTDPSRFAHRVVRRYMLTGFLRCGRCGAGLVARSGQNKKRAYICVKGPGLPGCGGIKILAEPLEALLTEAVLYRLDSPALAQALAGESGDDGGKAASVAAAIAEDDLQLEQLAGMWARKELSYKEFLTARQVIQERLEVARSRLARGDRFAALRQVSGRGDELRQRWPELNLEQRRAIIKTILDRLVIKPAGRNRRIFNPDRVEPIWRV